MRFSFRKTNKAVIVSTLMLCLSISSVAGTASASSIDPANHSHHSTHHGHSGHLVVTPSSVVLSSDGNAYAYFALKGQGLAANHTYKVEDSFTGACSSDDLNGDLDTTDLNGRFQDYSASSGCQPGTYTVTAFDQSYPFDSYSTQVKFLSPRN